MSSQGSFFGMYDTDSSRGGRRVPKGEGDQGRRRRDGNTRHRHHHREDRDVDRGHTYHERSGDGSTARRGPGRHRDSVRYDNFNTSQHLAGTGASLADTRWTSGLRH